MRKWILKKLGVKDFYDEFPFPPPSNYRPRRGDCPDCGVDERTWCEEDCNLLDPVDYR